MGTLSYSFVASGLVLEDNIVTGDSLLGGRGVGICGGFIGDGLIRGPVGTAAGGTLGSDALLNVRISGIVGAAVGFTLGSDALFNVRISGVVGVTMGITLSSVASFDIYGMLFGNCGGASRWRMIATSMNAFVVVFPYTRDGIGDLGACNMSMMLDAA